MIIICFRDICAGWPGSVHDARVLVNSSLYKKATEGKILTGSVLKVAGTPIFNELQRIVSF